MHRKAAVAALTVGWILLSCFIVTAHHSVASNFDQGKTLDVMGKVKEIAIRNPHSQITLEVAKPGGGTSQFYVEWSDKNALMLLSVPVSTMHVADTVMITLPPCKRLPTTRYFRTPSVIDGTI